MPNTVVLIIAIKLYFQSLVSTARYGKRKSLLETKKSYHKLFVFIATYKTLKKKQKAACIKFILFTRNDKQGIMSPILKLRNKGQRKPSAFLLIIFAMHNIYMYEEFNKKL